MPLSRALSKKTRFVMGASLFIGLIAACNLSDDDFFTTPFPGSSGTSGVPVPTASAEPVTPCTYANLGYACNYGGASICESGKNGNAECNDLLRCNGYEWELENGAKTKREAGVCNQVCPVEPVLQDGGAPIACDQPASNALICEYQLTTCGCGHPTARKSDAGKTDAGTEAGVDAGFVDGGPPLVWTCVDPGPGCPRVRPRIGQPCVKQIACDYGACTFDDGLAVKCTGGYWLKDTQAFCP